MSRKYMNDRWCVRCGRQGMTPFLRDSLKKIEPQLALDGLTRGEITVVDIGCGNGRNLKALAERGYTRLNGYDMCGDSAYAKTLLLGAEPLQEEDGSVDLVLANYVFMFLDEAETKQVLAEINRITHHNSMLVIELYPAKDSRIKSDGEMKLMQHALFNELEKGLPETWMWEQVRWCKGKCVLRKFQLPRAR